MRAKKSAPREPRGEFAARNAVDNPHGILLHVHFIELQLYDITVIKCQKAITGRHARGHGLRQGCDVRARAESILAGGIARVVQREIVCNARIHQHTMIVLDQQVYGVGLYVCIGIFYATGITKILRCLPESIEEFTVLDRVMVPSGGPHHHCQYHYHQCQHQCINSEWFHVCGPYYIYIPHYIVKIEYPGVYKMTIHGFSKVFTPTQTRVEYSHFTGKRLALDASIEIFRTATVVIGTRLTNKRGEPTQHIKLTFDNALKMIALDIDATWCFDGTRAPVLKEDTLAARAQKRAATETRIAAMHDRIDDLDRISAEMSEVALLDLDPTFHETRAGLVGELSRAQQSSLLPGEFSRFKSDVFYILQHLGVRCMIAPAGVDAEHLAAWLSKSQKVDGVITSDPDALLYGSRNIIKHRYKDAGRYDVYDAADILARYEITHKQLVQVGVALGTDFAEKTPGVGPRRVLQAVKNKTITWSDAQLAAMEHFRYTVVEPEVVQSARTVASVRALRDWLVNEQNFNAVALDKRLAFLLDPAAVKPVKPRGSIKRKPASR